MQLLNFFLSGLHPTDLADLWPHLVEVSLSPGQVLFEPEAEIGSLYFPGSACVSIVTPLTDGKVVETSTVGRESAVGLIDVMTAQPARSRIFAQVGGGAMRLSAHAFRARLHASPSLMDLSLRHVRANNLQAEQGAACNAAHAVQERLARWLLMTQDRVGADSFPLTQEYMAVMTGVQRSTVSLMASELKRRGVIDYARGDLRILDRQALEHHACECYGIIGRQFEELRGA